MVCALEQRECSTLFNKGRGTNRIEGIGDKMVTLIHSVLTTDYVALIHDDDCLMGLDPLERRQAFLERILKLREGSLQRLHGLFGISSICNIIGSTRMARFLNLNHEDDVVIVATDGLDRYPPVLADLETRRGPLTGRELGPCFEEVFRGGDAWEILDVRPREQKYPLFGYRRSSGRLPAIPLPFGKHEINVLLGRRVRQYPTNRCHPGPDTPLLARGQIQTCPGGQLGSRKQV